MFKIAQIETKEVDKDFIDIARIFEDMKFSVTIKKSNSKQLDSNIDERIIEQLSRHFKVTKSKSELLVQADGEKVGELDIVFRDADISYYMEVEKSNKKTLWFDYIKILTKLADDPKGKGIIMTPKNYAHKVGVWNLYKEAVLYKNHLKRVFGGDALSRVAVMGYTQYAHIDGHWKEYDSEVIQRIKNS
jgi:Holliday junction resolvase-like predicted endonuclease